VTRRSYYICVLAHMYVFMNILYRWWCDVFGELYDGETIQQMQLYDADFEPRLQHIERCTVLSILYVSV
jgi:hypothetical protein